VLTATFNQPCFSEFLMGQLDSIYHEKEENVTLMCGWTTDGISKPDEELVNESPTDELAEEQQVVVEVEDKEEEVGFPRTIADPSVISCHLLINLLNDAMTMLRYYPLHALSQNVSSPEVLLK